MSLLRSSPVYQAASTKAAPMSGVGDSLADSPLSDENLRAFAIGFVIVVCVVGELLRRAME